MSAFPQHMLLWPNGQARRLNSENRIRGEINGVAYVVDLKGDFALCAFVDPRTGETRRMVQPHFSALALMTARVEIAEGRPFTAEGMALRPHPDGTRTLDGD